MADFGVSETMLAISAATAAASAAAAQQSAQAQRTAQNKTADAQRLAARNAAEANTRQADLKASSDRRNAISQTQKISGRIRTAAAESGVGLSGSFENLDNQAAIDGGNSLRNLDLSHSFTRQSIQSGLDVSLAEIVNQPRSVTMDTIQGGIGGLTTGIQIGSAVEGMQAAAERRKREQAALNAVQ